MQHAWKYVVWKLAGISYPGILGIAIRVTLRLTLDRYVMM